MKYSKVLLFISCVMVLAVADQLGEVVDGNYNDGVGNTILSAGNFVKGDGNIVASLDSDLDIFGGDPFFSSTDLYDPIQTQQTTPTITSPIYPGPIPTAITTQQTVVAPTTTQTQIVTPVASEADESQTIPAQTTQVTHTETVQATPTTEGTSSTTVTTKTTETTTTTSDQSKVGSSSGQVKVQSKGQGYMYAGILGLITAIIVAS